MGILDDLQIFVLAMGGVSCLVFALFAWIIRYQSIQRKQAIFLLELAASIILNADIVSFEFSGSTDTIGYWMTKMSNFCVFFFLYLELYALGYYLCTFIVANGGEIPKAIKIANILIIIGSSLVIVSLFTGMFFYVDSDGFYQRGPLFLIAYLIPLVIYFLIFGAALEHRRMFTKIILASFIAFAILPLVGSVVQMIFSTVYLLDMSIGLAAIVIFAFSLIDQNNLLLQIASVEKMTGLPNAYGLMSEIGKKIGMKTITKYNAFYFDIVRMGLINRKFGNDAGDAVIVKYAETIRERMHNDEVLGRLGGNYFVALVRKENTQSFLDWLSGIPIEVETPMGTETVVVSAVAGGYEIEDKKGAHITPPQILTNVSMAVNVAKNIVKKPYVFLTQELQQQLNEQRQLQEMIPECMQKKEFMPFYQPKVNSETNSLAGAEALVRWRHDGELVMPGRYIPIMEQNESICKLDFYMLDYVCSDIKEWLDKGMNPPVISVNFSRKNLGNPDLAEQIYDVIKKHDIPVNLIQIEVTETVDDYPIEVLRNVVEQLQSYGMSAAIDDFGTGSSSIKILKEVPFNVLKIDKSFIDSTTERSYKILGYIIAMAKSMDAGVITEGVEHEEQINILEQLGCTEIQGYYYDKPLSKEMFEQRLIQPNYKAAE